MKILYLHQYFKSLDEPGGHRSYFLAQKLIEKGHKVIVVTSNSDHRDWDFIKKKEVDGIEVIYIRSTYSNYMGNLKRIMSFLKFMFASTIVSLRIKGIDLVFATSTPLTIGIPVLIMKWIKQKRYVFEVRDLWPDAPISVGAISSNVIIKFLYLLEKIVYDNSEHIIALSPGMLSGITGKGVLDEKVSLIPNMSNLEYFYPRKKDKTLAKIFDIDLSKFNIIHFGTIGLANGLETILETAKICENNCIKDVDFTFLGYGKQEPILKRICEKNNLSNVKFLGNQLLKTVSEIVNLCDCSIVSFMKLDILKTNSPNKLFDSLSAGKPIIVNSNGWTKDLVENYGCGYYTDPDRPIELYQKIIEMKDNKGMTKQLGKNARKLAESKFDKNKLGAGFVLLLERVYHGFNNKIKKARL